MTNEKLYTYLSKKDDLKLIDFVNQSNNKSKVVKDALLLYMTLSSFYDTSDINLILLKMNSSTANSVHEVSETIEKVDSTSTDLSEEVDNLLSSI